MVGAPQAGFLSDDNLWFWLALFGPWKNKNPVFTELHIERAQPPPLPCNVLPHPTWILDVPQGKKKKCGKPSDPQNNIDLCSVSEKRMKSPWFAGARARCIPPGRPGPGEPSSLFKGKSLHTQPSAGSLPLSPSAPGAKPAEF